MKKRDTLSYCNDYLFADEEKMIEARVPDTIQRRILRIRDVYNQWLRNPSKQERQLVAYLKENYGASQTQAYEDLSIVKVFIGNVSSNTKDFMRWKVNDMIEQTFSIAKNRKDARGMAAASMAYIKANHLDKTDEINIDWNEKENQPFDITFDPRVLKIEPIPNIYRAIDNLMKKVSGGDIQDIECEEIDMKANLPENFEEYGA